MKKFYVTTSIAYVNAPPHLGFSLESLQADALARYRRQKGGKVFFLTGTDEHGAKIARAAEALNKTPKQLVDQNAKKFKALKKLHNLSWDDFIRTSDKKRHWPNVAALWKKLVKAGDIYKKKYKGFYCVGHEAFVTEKDLVDGKCRDHGAAPEIIEEENYFFRLSKYAKEIELIIKDKKLRFYPESRANEILSFIKQGVEDISFSRPRKDLSWGIPVPGDNSQTVYVWCDALTNYLYPKGWWPADLHIIGKDILRFHALYWPAMLLSAKLPLPKAIFVHGHITVEGQKMSKSLGNVVDPFALVGRAGVDAVRYYLLREISPFEDGDFSYSKFKDRYNADLANGLGNFTARVLALATKNTPSVSKVPTEVENFIKLARKAVDQKMDEYKLNEALEAVWELVRFGDKYINAKKPWATGDSKVIFNAVVILDNVAALLKSFLPDTADKITKSIQWIGNDKLKVKKIKTLFPRV